MTRLNEPPVGVLAKTQHQALSLAHELGIKNAIGLSPRGTGHRGLELAILLVDEALWPMSRDLANEFVPCLKARCGYVLAIHRFDPQSKTGLPVLKAAKS